LGAPGSAGDNDRERGVRGVFGGTLKHHKQSILFAIYVSLLGAVTAQESAERLLNQLHVIPLDLSVPNKLEHLPDKRVLPALRQAFDEHAAKNERQYIAIALVHLGDNDDKYFNFLAQYAQAAVESSAPPLLARDEKGNSIRGEMNPDFEAWAKQSGLPAKEAAAQQFYTYPEDVMFLGKARDPRGLPILKRGLQSRNEVIVLMAAEALVLADDVTAVPLIIQEGRVRGTGMASMLASTLALYKNPEALRLIDQSLVDPELRRTYEEHRATLLKQKH
jgi:hypothetical protein